jgi:hypothetical protein
MSEERCWQCIVSVEAWWERQAAQIGFRKARKATREEGIY